MRVFRGASEILNAKGEELGCSEWVKVTQEQVDTFAEATYDYQRIHVDTGRAASGPFGGTIAHGHLTLSLLPYLASQIYRFEGVHAHQLWPERSASRSRSASDHECGRGTNSWTSSMWAHSCS
jgi:MaoC like domain